MAYTLTCQESHCASDDSQLSLHGVLGVLLYLIIGSGVRVNLDQLQAWYWGKFWKTYVCKSSTIGFVIPLVYMKGVSTPNVALYSMYSFCISSVNFFVIFVNTSVVDISIESNTGG